ncbi:hypothetical protein AXF42_Ash003053 [Apostasia shenzhenica]|uniref:Uncharacterized protein n=1 Tax=Apostasia shenzhenica TaxID=1088818 RepID=A0A2I0A821_9ASPA|nr:hypothetical protein AXF42_Ash003053 [Apostasia shenzhenica]
MATEVRCCAARQPQDGVLRARVGVGAEAAQQRRRARCREDAGAPRWNHRRSRVFLPQRPADDVDRHHPLEVRLPSFPHTCARG